MTLRGSSTRVKKWKCDCVIVLVQRKRQKYNVSGPGRCKSIFYIDWRESSLCLGMGDILTHLKLAWGQIWRKTYLHFIWQFFLFLFTMMLFLYGYHWDFGGGGGKTPAQSHFKLNISPTHLQRLHPTPRGCLPLKIRNWKISPVL